PLVGSYNSAVVRTLVVSSPPATSTFPLPSSVAVWLTHGTLSEPVAVQVAVAGSYNSALATAEPVTELPVIPPATSTLPFGSNVAVCSVLPTFIDPVFVH